MAKAGKCKLRTHRIRLELEEGVQSSLGEVFREGFLKEVMTTLNLEGRGISQRKGEVR